MFLVVEASPRHRVVFLPTLFWVRSEGPNGGSSAAALLGLQKWGCSDCLGGLDLRWRGWNGEALGAPGGGGVTFGGNILGNSALRRRHRRRAVVVVAPPSSLIHPLTRGSATRCSPPTSRSRPSSHRRCRCRHCRPAKCRRAGPSNQVHLGAPCRRRVVAASPAASSSRRLAVSPRRVVAASWPSPRRRISIFTSILTSRLVAASPFSSPSSLYIPAARCPHQVPSLGGWKLQGQEAEAGGWV